MLLLLRVLSLFPLGLLQVIGWLLGWLAFLVSPTYRRRFVENATLAGCSRGQMAAAVGHAGCMVGELPRLWLGRPLPFRWDDGGCIQRAFDAGRGIVFLTPHMGCFELSPQALAADYSERQGPMTILYRPARQPWLARAMASVRERPGLQAVPTTLAGVRQLIKALRQGRAVGLLPDQVPPEGMGAWSPFFGRPAYTMTLAARLVQQTGATVLLAWSERLSWGRGVAVHVREMREPLSADMDTALAQLNAEMEQLIRACPAQYLWGYARYKPPRGEL
ncbi:lysophospholipid acyltransferase family protein [Curvibacter sp. HBC61]|uniref:Lysophospholipid acyltransferase family protein n=1 Tax=Curvibacter cyanobacteriorum TaxID=3026422 RepID=A0ABT5N0H3_9BURK|nr:lysophospholipid acyltransferase family protein [Curvibacter sp. HBC61]MDD0839156.1 lysophospholipid acyltransferase family protein [Curvibacter sp. HBC61]